ncbi:hypothetical protein D0Z00_000829 [Geotrichum galactomycetum]|uniref:Uncharacterized protein n=1 Tax=Geotrichum galactomycetum TaxID=27317 RepID=A0ACB6V8R2_9ASCO|nr:hypothetical protein D0Z00_000829 [Geotrichum candidum]
MASSSIATPGAPPPPLTTATSTSTTTATATAVMAQEISAVQTLKRLSIGASLTLDPDLPNYNDYTATSPTSEQAFDFSSTQSLNAASQQLLWVPAHVHPEIAPQQWKNFVQDKLAEIKASGHSTSSSTSAPIKRRNSSLSRQIKDQEHYTDGADVLEKRKSVDNLQQQNHDPTILSLSQKLESLGELEGWSVDPINLMRTLSMSSTESAAAPLLNDSDSPILPSPTSSLRRSKHTRYNKPSMRRGRRGLIKNDTDENNNLTPTISITASDLQSSSDSSPVSDIPPPPPPKDNDRKVKRVRIPITNKPLSECPEPVGNDYNNVPKLGSPKHKRPSMKRQPEAFNIYDHMDNQKVNSKHPEQSERRVERVPVGDSDKAKLTAEQASGQVHRVPPPVPKDRQYKPDQPERQVQQQERSNDRISRIPVAEHQSTEQNDKIKVDRVPVNKNVVKGVESQTVDQPHQQQPPRHAEEKAERRPVTEHRPVVDKVERKPIDKDDRKPVTDKIERKPVCESVERRIHEPSIERKAVSEPAGEQSFANESVELEPVGEPVGQKPVEKSTAEKKSIEQKPGEQKPVEQKPVELPVQNVTPNGHDVEHKISNALNHTAHQVKKHVSDRVGRKQMTEHVERKPVSETPERKPVHEAGKPAHEPIERKPVKEQIERIPVASFQQNPSVQPEVVEHRHLTEESTHRDPVELESKEVLSHSRSKNRKGTWGWLFNGVSSPPTGRNSPENKVKSSSSSSSLPEQFDSMTADKASIDKFLNRKPSPNPVNSFMSTTMTQGTMTPEVVVTTSEETVELVENNHNDYSGGSTSRKISSSASIAETKDRISNFFSKKKSMANIKQQRQQERANSRTPSPGRSHSRSPVAKHRGRYRSRSRHRSASPKPVTEPVAEPVAEPEPEMRAMDQVDFVSEATMSGIIPQGMEPTTNAAGLISYSAEAAAFYGAPYQIPAYQYSDKSLYMMNHRYEPHIERAIYRLSHLKLGNARRPLAQQVLLSNFMYAYLNLINQGFIRQQQEAQLEIQRQQQQQLKMQQQHQQQMQQHQLEHQEQYGDDPDDLETGGGHGQKPSYDHMYDYTTTTTADSSSSSSASSVAGDDLWQEDTFYDSQEVS